MDKPGDGFFPETLSPLSFPEHFSALSKDRQKEVLKERVLRLGKLVLAGQSNPQLDLRDPRILSGVSPELFNPERDFETLVDLRQFLASLHEDHAWNSRETQQRYVRAFQDQFKGLLQKPFTPESDECFHFYLSDLNYELTWGIDPMEWDGIPDEQKKTDERKLKNAWYIGLHNQRLGIQNPSRIEESVRIAKTIAEVGLPLRPSAQQWLKQELKREMYPLADLLRQK